MATTTAIINSYLLTEDGDYLLYEDGCKIIIGQDTIEDCPVVTLKPRDFTFTLFLRGIEFTLKPRDASFTLQARDVAYSLKKRITSFTLRNRQ